MSETRPPRPRPEAPDPTDYARKLAELYKEHQKRLLSMARRWAPPSIAPDLLQNVFRDLLARPRTITEFLPYVSGALRKAAKNARRKEKKQGTVKSALERVRLDGAPLDVPSPEDSAWKEQQLHEQLDALGRKAPQAFKAIELVRLQGLTEEQAGQQMRLSRDQVSRLIRRVRRAAVSALTESTPFDRSRRALESVDGEREASSTRRDASSTRRRRRKAGPLMVAAIAILTALIPLRMLRESELEPTAIVTRIDSARGMTLPDGTVINYAPHANFKVDFRAKERIIQLTSGGAEFKVAPDKNRPFKVITQGAQVKAVGTRFLIDRYNHWTLVSVLEGVVEVTPRSRDGRASATTLTLHAGERISIPDDEPQSRWEPSESIASSGWLEMNNVTVAEAIDAFHQFNELPIKIEGAEVAARRLGYGRVRVDSPESFLRMLERAEGIAVIRGAHNELIVTSKTDRSPASTAPSIPSKRAPP